jgi:hypothetical protein
MWPTTHRTTTLLGNCVTFKAPVQFGETQLYDRKLPSVSATIICDHLNGHYLIERIASSFDRILGRLRYDIWQ